MKLLNLKKPMLGIDLGSRNIKAVEIKKARNGFRITHMARVGIPNGAIKQGLFHDNNMAMALMREVQGQMKIGNQGAFVAFSGQNAIIREIEMPIMAEREIAEAIFWEAKKVLPYPVEEAIVDWITLERTRETDQMMSVLLVAGRRDYIKAYLKPLKSVGIQPLNLDILPTPILYILQQIPEFKQYSTTAIIDMGAEATHVLITKDGLPRLARTIPTGGNDFTEHVATSFSISYEEAEKVKLEFGTLEKQEIDLSTVDLISNPFLGIEEVLENIVQDVFSEIKRSFIHFQLHNRGQLIERVYLTGGASLLPGMGTHLEQFLNVQVNQLDIAKYFQYEPELGERLQTEGAFFTEALGLALSEV